MERLREQDVWDKTNVREWDDVRAEAEASGTECHLAHIIGIMVEKGSGPDKNDGNRKYKYRVVFNGNQVKDQNWKAAMFQDLGSALATMDCGHAAGQTVQIHTTLKHLKNKQSIWAFGGS